MLCTKSPNFRKGMVIKMKAIVVCNGKTGFTEKYGRWIAEELSCEMVKYEDMTKEKWEENDVIIYGGYIMAGRVNGLDKVKNELFKEGKKAVIYGVGATDRRAVEVIGKMKSDNLTEEEQQKAGFFYLEGGICYERMGFLPKIMLKMMAKSLKNKKDRTAEETGMMQTLEKSTDKTNKEYIKPLIEYVRKE